jgi:S-adenosylmethionine-diacylglycerol 3-amino-3-carboxypropyl transferase
MTIEDLLAKPQAALGRLRSHAHDLCFKGVHGNRLIYNACWEDPALDRQVMQIKSTSRIAMITSAGCNVLDYLLDDPEGIDAIDMNSRQNAVLELKLLLIRLGMHEELWALFGRGTHPNFSKLYKAIQSQLPDYARAFWRNKAHYFGGGRIKGSFYYHGASGDVAWLTRSLFYSNRRIRGHLEDLLAAGTVKEQTEIYAKLEPLVWNWACRMIIGSPLVMAMIGVPRAQSRLIDERYPGAMLGFIKDKLRHVFADIDIQSNYFWRVYLTGSHTPECCPNYLRPENLEFLRERAERVTLHTCSVAEALRKSRKSFTHFVLLDHQDWMAYHDHAALEDEWRLIFQRGQGHAKILLRSAGLDAEFLPAWLEGKVRWHPKKTAALHTLDRVGTYGSFHFGEIV